MRKGRGIVRHGVVMAAALALITSACGDGETDEGATADEGADEDGGGDADGSGDEQSLDALIEDAQEEGSLTFYSHIAEETNELVADGFSEEYGIDVTHVRATTETQARYATEAEGGNPVADVYISTSSDFLDEMVDAGYWTPLQEVGIPGYPEDYPEEGRLDERGSAVISEEPIGIAYNTDLVSDDEVPETWEDLADPQWEGEIILTNPFQSNTFAAVWGPILDEYGPDTVEAIGENVGTHTASSVPNHEALAAGEGSLTVFGYGAIVAGLQESGAPVALHHPDYTTSSGGFTLNVSAEASNPAAAKLFSHYLLFGDGHETLNRLPGTFSPVTREDGTGSPMPSEMVAPDPYTSELGVQLADLLDLDESDIPEEPEEE